jgi:hypothetical protein
MKKIALLIVAMIALSSASAQITQISSSKLPGQARTTISKAWNKAPIVDAWRNKMGKRIEYKASVEDGSTIKFNSAGSWIEVRSFNGIPLSLLPANIPAYIDKYYEGQMIVWASRNTRRYQIQLANGTKLEFNSKGVFQAFL